MAVRNDKIFWLDLPNPFADSNDQEWVNIGQFKTLEDAQRILRERYGIEAEDSKVFITQGN